MSREWKQARLATDPSPAAAETTTHEHERRPGHRPMNQLVNSEDGGFRWGPGGGGTGFHKEHFGLPHVDSEQVLGVYP